MHKTKYRDEECYEGIECSAAVQLQFPSQEMLVVIVDPSNFTENPGKSCVSYRYPEESIHHCTDARRGKSDRDPQNRNRRRRRYVEITVKCRAQGRHQPAMALDVTPGLVRTTAHAPRQE